MIESFFYCACWRCGHVFAAEGDETLAWPERCRRCKSPRLAGPFREAEDAAVYVDTFDPPRDTDGDLWMDDDRLFKGLIFALVALVVATLIAQAAIKLGLL